VEESQQRLSLRMTAYGVRFPYRFERTLTVEAGQSAVRLAYRLTNFAPQPLPFVWAVHPLLNIAPGMQLHLPVEQVRLVFATDPALGRVGEVLSWPGSTKFDLAQIPPRSMGQAVKLYTLPLGGSDPVTAALTDPYSGRSFAFHFDPAEITHIALWLNYGGWSPLAGTLPYYNLGFEPCIGGGDSLAEAAARSEVGLAGPRQTKTWQLEIDLR
jgi:galactose mutarotase-like enzyme